MLETPHVAVGAAIAIKVGNPALAIPLALASHFVLDIIPHWNPHTYTETEKNGKPSKSTFTIAIIDATAALALGVGIAATRYPDIGQMATIIACSFAAVFPDVSKYPFFLFNSLRKGLYKKWVSYERKLQEQTDSLFWGLLTQVITTAAAIFWII